MLNASDPKAKPAIEKQDRAVQDKVGFQPFQYAFWWNLKESADEALSSLSLIVT